MNYLETNEKLLASIDSDCRRIAELANKQGKSNLDIACWKAHYTSVLRILNRQLGWPSGSSGALTYSEGSLKRRLAERLFHRLSKILEFSSTWRGESPILAQDDVRLTFPPEFAIYQMAYGFSLCSNGLDMVEGLATGHYGTELAETLIVFRLLPWIDRFIDVGANIGFYSFLVASQGDGQIRVISFEPSSENFALLSAGIQTNRLGGVIEALRMAVGDAHRTAELHLYSFGSGGHSLRPNAAFAPFDRSENVEVDTLDHLSSTRELTERRCLIKIDVEGAEHQVFAGGKEWLASKVFAPIILFEAWPNADPQNPRKAVRCLENDGYKLYRVEQVEHKRPAISAIDASGTFKAALNGNYLALPKWALDAQDILMQPVDIRVFSDSTRVNKLKNFLQGSRHSLERRLAEGKAPV